MARPPSDVTSIKEGIMACPSCSTVAPRPEKRTWTDESKPGPPTKLPQNGQLHFQVMTGDPQVRILNVKLNMWCFLLAQRCLLAENRRWIWQMQWRKNVNLEKNYWLRVALGKAQVAALRVKNLIWSSGSRISELSCVCVTHLHRCKTSIVYIIYMRGVTGVPGGRWPMKTPPRDPCKRTRRTSVVHLGAFKSQLVATVVLYIYICIHPYLSN